MMSDYIPDPVELMEQRIEHECDKVTGSTYPCYNCGKRYSLENHPWICMSPLGDGPLLCTDCQPDMEPK